MRRQKFLKVYAQTVFLLPILCVIHICTESRMTFVEVVALKERNTIGNSSIHDATREDNENYEASARR